jgi:hypothetical protein
MDKAPDHTRAGLLAALGSAAFTATWAVLGQLSDGYTMWDITVTSYSPTAQPISGLGLGSTAPVMNTAFVLCGALISVGTWKAMGTWPGAGTRSVRWARRAVASCGVGMAICGIFDLESIMFHTLGFLLAVGLPGVGFILAGRALRETGHRRLSSWLRFAGPVTLLSLAAYLAMFNATDAGNNEGFAGLVQRILITVVMISVGAIGLSGRAHTTTLAAPGQVLEGSAGAGRH